MDFIVSLLVLAIFVFFIWQIFALVGDMAERRGQDRLLWQIASLFINPFGAMVLLWLFCSVKHPET